MTRKPALFAGAALAVLALGAGAWVALSPPPPSSRSGRIAVGDDWSSPYGATFRYDRWEAAGAGAFHVVVEEGGKQRGVVVRPQGSDLWRETAGGVPWRVVSFEGMTTDGSDWIVVEAKQKPAGAASTASSPDHRP